MEPVNRPEAAPTPPPAAPERPVLRRSADDRVLFGVAGGLARYLGIDSTIVRIAFVLLLVFGGSGALLYLIGLVVIPAERPGEAVGAGVRGGGVTPGVVIGGTLIVVGALALARQLVPDVGWLAGPLLLILAGVVVLRGSRR